MRLVLEGEHRADQEQDTVDDGQDSLAQGQLIGFGDIDLNVVVVLDEENSRCEEHSGTEQTEEDLDALVDGSSQALGCASIVFLNCILFFCKGN